MPQIIVDNRAGETAKGDQGPAGLQGPRGSGVITEPRAPLSTDGETGDVFINALTGELFKKVLGSWVFEGSLLGPESETGQVDGGTPSESFSSTSLIDGGTP